MVEEYSIQHNIVCMCTNLGIMQERLHISMYEYMYITNLHICTMYIVHIVYIFFVCICTGSEYNVLNHMYDIYNKHTCVCVVLRSILCLFLWCSI